MQLEDVISRLEDNLTDENSLKEAFKSIKLYNMKTLHKGLTNTAKHVDVLDGVEVDDIWRSFHIMGTLLQNHQFCENESLLFDIVYAQFTSLLDMITSLTEDIAQDEQISNFMATIVAGLLLFFLKRAAMDRFHHLVQRLRVGFPFLLQKDVVEYVVEVDVAIEQGNHMKILEMIESHQLKGFEDMCTGLKVTVEQDLLSSIANSLVASSDEGVPLNCLEQLFEGLGLKDKYGEVSDLIMFFGWEVDEVTGNVHFKQNQEQISMKTCHPKDILNSCFGIAQQYDRIV
ncbi:hypothetical protein PCE1_000722 [Barthelona sp. PCE]